MLSATVDAAPGVTARAALSLNALPVLGAGYSFRRAYQPETYAQRARIGPLEIVADHFFAQSAQAELDLLAEHFTLIPHGLDLSLGSADGIDEAYLEKLAALIARVKAPWWSEHVAFTRTGGIRIGHLAPLPFTREALEVLERNIARVRERIDVPLLLENIAAPIVLSRAEMDEPQFLRELVARTGCGLLLDVENLNANAHNHAYDVDAYLRALPRDAVVQLHVAGGEWLEGTYVDSHARPVAGDTWSLAERVCRCFPIKAIVIERDERLPEFEDLLAEIERARKIGVAAGCWS